MTMEIFYLPDLGEGLAEAEIHNWYVKPGDMVRADQPMVSVETAKALVDVPAPHAGVIKKLYANPGDIIPTHAPLVEFVSAEQTFAKKDAGTVVGELPIANVVLEETEGVGIVQTARHKIRIIPAVRSLATSLQLDIENIVPTGAQGQITVEDVKKAAEKTQRGTPTDPSLSAKHSQQVTGVRRTMAHMMMRSHAEVVPATLMEDADITEAPPDFTVFLLQALVSALQKVPSLNATFLYDDKTHNMYRLQHTEISIGLAVDSAEGLFVPVLKNIAGKSAQTLRDEIQFLRAGVKSRTLPPDAFQGATFSLSNFGMIAGRYASPVLVPPAVGILGCGRIQEEVCVYKNDIARRRKVPLSLTFDHRIVTGGEAAHFLAAVISALEISQ